MIAFLFVTAYVAVATGGSWVWLKSKSMTKHAWTAFAILATCGSAVSIGAVQFIRGIGLDVQELSIVDTVAGQTQANATSYFGLKSATHTTLDLRVPTDATSPNDIAPASPPLLKPLPKIGTIWSSESTTYSAGMKYEAIASLGELRNVPFRATLKQFECRWNGPLNGRVTASLVRETGGMDLLESSWIQNDLDTDLEECYLFVPNLDRSGSLAVSRAMQIRAIQSLPKLEVGTRVSIGQWLQYLTQKQRTQSRRQDATYDQGDLSLAKLHSEWLKALRIRIDRYGDQERPNVRVNASELLAALMLLTTFDEIDQTAMRQRHDNELYRTACEHLDLSMKMRRDTALFIGFSRQPGPTRLCRRTTSGGEWRAIEPEQATVMYRVLIPVGEE